MNTHHLSLVVTNRKLIRIKRSIKKGNRRKDLKVLYRICLICFLLIVEDSFVSVEEFAFLNACTFEFQACSKNSPR
jgi:hypothetical protein